MVKIPINFMICARISSIMLNKKEGKFFFKSTPSFWSPKTNLFRENEYQSNATTRVLIVAKPFQQVLIP